MSDGPVVTAQGTVAQQAPKAASEAAAIPAPSEAEKAFALKEKQLHRQRQAIQAERDALQAKIKEYETGYIPKARVTEDPFAVLGELGLDNNKLTEILLSTPQDPATKAMMAKIKAMEAKLGEAARAQEEAQTKQYEQALGQIKKEAQMLISSDKRFEVIKARGAEDAVVELIKETFEKEGYLMDVDKAAEEVENYLIEEGLKYAALGKIQKRVQPAVKEETAVVKGQTQGMKTLTNSVNANATSGRLTEKQRKERAIAAFNGKLNT